MHSTNHRPLAVGGELLHSGVYLGLVVLTESLIGQESLRLGQDLFEVGGRVGGQWQRIVIGLLQ